MRSRHDGSSVPFDYRTCIAQHAGTRKGNCVGKLESERLQYVCLFAACMAVKTCFGFILQNPAENQLV